LSDANQPSCPSTLKQVFIDVNPSPLVNLSSSDLNNTICENEGLAFTAAPFGYDSYNFMSGSEILQSGANPIYNASTLENNDGLKVIAIDNGCLSEASSEIQITVNDSLLVPKVNCDSTSNTSISIVWDSIIGATAYEVSIDEGLFVVPSGSLLHTLAGLTSGESHSFSVKALGDLPCGNSQESILLTCASQPCSPISFDLINDTAVCKGESVSLELTNISAIDYSLSWNGGITQTSNTNNFIAINDTLIVVELIDSTQLACSSISKSVFVNVLPIPSVSVVSSAINDTICEGSELIFTASPQGYDNYEFYNGYLSLQSSSNHEYQTSSWSNGDSLFVIGSNNGCSSSTDSAIATKVYIIDLLNVPQVNCGTTTLDAIEFIWDDVEGALGYEVSINGFAFTSPSSGNLGVSHTITGLNAGDALAINVVTLDGSPCIYSEMSSLARCSTIICNEFNVDILPDTSVCEFESLELIASNVSAANYSLSWAGESAGTDLFYEIDVTQDTIITSELFDLDQPACPSVIKFIEVSMNSIPVVNLVSSLINDSICEADNYSFEAVPAGFDNYQFYEETNLIQDSVYQVLKMDYAQSNRAVFVSVSDKGCTFLSDTIYSEVISLPVVNLSSSLLSDTICGNDSIIFEALPSTYLKYEFLINDTVQQDSTLNSFKKYNLINGDSVSVQVTNYFGCIANNNNSRVMTVRTIPSIAIVSSDADSSICNGDSISFTAAPNNFASYHYYNTDSVIEISLTEIYSTTTLPDSNSIYVIGIDSYGCYSRSSDTIVTEIKPIPTTSLALDTTIICDGSSITIRVEDQVYSGTTFSWNLGDVTDSIVVSPAIETKYWVEAILNNCTSQADTVMVQVENEVPSLSLDNDVTICREDSIEIIATGAMSYIWDLRDGFPEFDTTKSNPKVSPYDHQVYLVTGYNLACFSQDSILVMVDKCLSDISGPIPEVFSPNGDGVNDYFIIPDIDYFTNNTLVIYNRWGNLVYAVDGYVGQWDGSSSENEQLTDGTYYYILDLGNEKEPYTGFIMIHR
jgi:gliding motility-associated-like protein